MACIRLCRNSSVCCQKIHHHKLRVLLLVAVSLRKHPFLFALRRWGRFARRTKRPQRRRARRNGCFRRLCHCKWRHFQSVSRARQASYPTSISSPRRFSQEWPTSTEKVMRIKRMITKAECFKGSNGSKCLKKLILILRKLLDNK